MNRAETGTVGTHGAEGADVVVVGCGMAGSRLVQELVARDPGLRIIVVGAEPHAPYNRILLSNVLAGRTSAEAISLPTPPPGGGVTFRRGSAVTSIDREAQQVIADDGRRTSYDFLVLATGSRPVWPQLDGLRSADGGLLPGVAAFRTLDDCDRISGQIEAARRAVVLGGGLLGLEAARGLAMRGLPVDVLHRAGHLMDRQLDAGAGAVLAATLRRLGVRIRVGVRVTAVLGAEHVTGVLLDDGEVIPADLLVVACGVRPETALARECGLDVQRGIVVDDSLRTSDPRVYALGECAQHDGQVYGLVAPAWEQAAVLADVLTQRAAQPRSARAARYRGSRLVIRLKAADIELAAMGETAAAVDEAESNAEVVQFVDPARGTYKKVVIRDGQLVGAILLGDIGTVGSVTQLYDRGSQVPADRLALLFAGRGVSDTLDTPAGIPDAATICRCNGVTKGAITDCWVAGARTADEVTAATRAATGCGSCRDAVDGILSWLAASDSVGRNKSA